ncbi:MAG: response regulator [Methyloprofundus sp.]|nr:response regulator [Methyloprofundus sp.]
MQKFLLLVEDNPINQKLAQKTLALLGYKVNTAADGEQALTIYKNTPENIALIFMDGEMPVLNGFAATKAIRQWEQENGVPSTPIIAWTAAYGLLESQEKWLSAGVDGFLSKPFDFKQIQNILHQWLGNPPMHVAERDNVAPTISFTQTACKLDVQALQQLFELEKNSPGLIKRLIVKYEQQGMLLLQQLEANLQQENSEGIRQAAHSLKSTSASFGATELAINCKKIEQKPELFDDIAMQLASLQSLFAQALLALQRLEL